MPHWSHHPEISFGPLADRYFSHDGFTYGRGGSPLQNLIQRGNSSTMLTALRCCDGLDTGDVYLKQPLDLHGSGRDLYKSRSID